MSDEVPWIVRRSPSPEHVLAAALEAALDDALRPTESPPRDFLDIDGMSGRRYRLLINALVRYIADARYLEVGVWAGSTFCSAIADNAVRAVAVDNWSQFGGSRDDFLANVARFEKGGGEVRLIESDFRAVDYAAQGRFNIYMFDGPHEEADQYDGLALALPALDDEFVLVVDDWNWQAVRNGTLRAIAALGLNEVHAVELRTTKDDTHPPHSGFDAKSTDWHNGYYLAVLRKTQPPDRLIDRIGRKLAGPVRRRAVTRAALDAQAVAEDHALAPEATEVLALITHHHRPERLPWLMEVIETFEAWPARRRAAIVVTNTATPAELDAIRACAPVAPRAGFSLDVATAPPLAHPHDLPWAQKPILAERFQGPRAEFTHVVSLEDDIATDGDAYLYWLRYRPLLAPHRLIPSFMRVEFRPGDDTPYATDSPTTNLLAARPTVRAGEFDFVALDKPYSAMSIMDRALVEEYADSPAFGLGSSMATSPWRTRERAAMGLCFESPPPGFPFRHVVPVDRNAHVVASCAQVRHLPGNYAQDPASPFAKIPARNVFR
jgi:hypothetical protein